MSDNPWGPSLKPRVQDATGSDAQVAAQWRERALLAEGKLAAQEEAASAPAWNRAHPDPDELKRLLSEGTPGPWATESDGVYNATRSYMVTPTGDSPQDAADAALIVAAVNSLPDLLAVVEAARDLDVQPCDFAGAASNPGFRRWCLSHGEYDRGSGCPGGNLADALATLDHQDTQPKGTS